MSNLERLNATARSDAEVVALAAMRESMGAFGVYHAALLSPRDREWYAAELGALLKGTPARAHANIINVLRRNNRGQANGDALLPWSMLTRAQAGALHQLIDHPFDVQWDDEYPNLITTVGKNDWGKAGFKGPCPPTGKHRYVTTVFALDTMLDVKNPDRAALLKAVAGHVVAKGELTGTYQKKK